MEKDGIVQIIQMFFTTRKKCQMKGYLGDPHNSFICGIPVKPLLLLRGVYVQYSTYIYFFVMMYFELITNRSD